MVVVISSYFSPNMVLRTSVVNFEKLTLPEFINEVRTAVDKNELVNIVQYDDTLEFISKLVGRSLPKRSHDIRITPNDKMLLVTIKGRKRYKDIWEALRNDAVYFWKVEVI